MRFGVLTGGGDCPGLNPAIRGVVLRATQRGHTVVGFRDGWKGVRDGLARPLEPADVIGIIDRYIEASGGEKIARDPVTGKRIGAPEPADA